MRMRVADENLRELIQMLLRGNHIVLHARDFGAHQIVVVVQLIVRRFVRIAVVLIEIIQTAREHSGRKERQKV